MAGVWDGEWQKIAPKSINITGIDTSDRLERKYYIYTSLSKTFRKSSSTTKEITRIINFHINIYKYKINFKYKKKHFILNLLFYEFQIIYLQN